MSAEMGKGAQKRLLIVEDDAEMRRLLMDEMVEEGYNVTPAADGSEAALLVTRQAFDLVITDMKMPRLGGLELLPLIRKTAGGTPVVMITAFGDWTSFIEAHERGATEFISKPFQMQQFKDTIRRLLQRSSEGSAAL